MALSVRVAPGISLRASDRGIGVSVDARGTQLRAGSDGAGISSNVGPLQFSTSVAARPTAPTSSGPLPVRTVTAAFDALAKRRDNRRQADLVAAKRLEKVLLSQHRQPVTPARRPTGPSPFRARLSPNRARRDRAALAARQQEIRDAEWAKVVAHEPFTIIALIEKAFDALQTPCACIDAGTDAGVHYVTVAILLPGREIAGPVRDDKSDRIRRRTNRETADFYAAVLASTVIGTARTAFAASPSTDQVRIVVLRRESRLLRTAFVAAIYSSSITRADVATDWRKISPEHVVFDAADLRIHRRGPHLVALDEKRNPDLAAIANLFGATLERQP